MSDLDLLAICDVETTGLNPVTDEVIELGCVLYSLSHNCVLQQVSTLVPVSVWVSPTERLNDISAASANFMGRLNSLDIAESLFFQMCKNADVIAAHNASFDRSFVADGWLEGCDTPWIDTRAIQWPNASRQGCSLVELALAYEIPVWSNHRALTDCQLLTHIIQREPLAPQLLAKELEPKVWATWRTTREDRAGQAKARAAGFRWGRDECPANGVWSRLMHPSDVAALPFEVVVIDVA